MYPYNIMQIIYASKIHCKSVLYTELALNMIIVLLLSCSLEIQCWTVHGDLSRSECCQGQMRSMVRMGERAYTHAYTLRVYTHTHTVSKPL